MNSAAPESMPGMRLSERLRTARNGLGLSLESASARSNVALRYAHMFEEGSYPMVADPVYLTSFVRRYAACLGLNEMQVSREFIAEAVNTRAEMRNAAPPVVPSRRIARANLGKSSTPAGSGSRRFRSRRFNFYAGPLSVITLAWTVSPFSPLNHRSEETPPRVSMTERHEEPSAILIATSTEPIQEPAGGSASATEASQPPAAELPAAAVAAPLPVAVNPEITAVATADRHLGVTKSKQKRATIVGNRRATDKASDALRAEQLARMKTANVPAKPLANVAGGA